MKDVKTKPPRGEPKILEKSVKIPQVAMKKAWIQAKEKTKTELKETPFSSQKEQSANAPPPTPASR